MWLRCLAFLFSSLCLWTLTVAQTDQIYITGTVALAGGAQLPQVVRVELKCHGSVVQSVLSSPDGHFSFRMSESNPGVKSRADGRRMDASIGGPAIPADVDKRTQVGKTAFHQVDLSRCQCEASLPGYQGDPVRLGVRSRFDNPDIGVMVLHPLDVDGTTVSVTSLKAPEKALKAYEQAEKELSKEKIKYSKVIEHLEGATELYPEFSEAWYRLGEAYTMEQQVDKAQKAFQQSIATDPMYIRPYVSLAQLELQRGKQVEAVQLTEKVLELNPNWIPASYCHAIAQYFLGEFDEAEESILKVQGSSEAHLYPASHHLLGNIYAEKGQYEAARKEFLLFLETKPAENFADEIEATIDDWKRAGLIE